MTNIDYSKYILPTICYNSDKDGENSQKNEYVTVDCVTIPMAKTRRYSPTSGAKVNGVYVEHDKTCPIFLRKSDGLEDNYFISGYDFDRESNTFGEHERSSSYFDYEEDDFAGGCSVGIVAEMQLDADEIAKDKSLFVIDEKNKTIEFGLNFDYVGDAFNNYLDEKFRTFQLTPTKRNFYNYARCSPQDECSEYELNGENYVSYERKFDCVSEYNQTIANKRYFLKRIPLVWEITNWKDLPTTINPNGKGISNTIKIRTNKAFRSGIPWHKEVYDNTRSDLGTYNSCFYQNSTVRGWLNSINLDNENVENRCGEILRTGGGDFTKCGFLQEAFDMTPEQILSLRQKENKIIKRLGLNVMDLETELIEGIEGASEVVEGDVLGFAGLEENDGMGTGNDIFSIFNNYGKDLNTQRDGIESEIARLKEEIRASQEEMTKMKQDIKAVIDSTSFDYTELSNDEILERCIKTRTPVFLHALSGVGKSSRVKQIDPYYSKISLTMGMNAEEIEGRLCVDGTIFNQPPWHSELCEKCEAEPDKIHVLFIDELTNVSPTYQSLVYDLVLERRSHNGKWILPENVVVVGAGNETEDSSAAFPLAEPLFRRFCHVYYPLDVQGWLNWGEGKSVLKPAKFVPKKVSKTMNIHPEIIDYFKSKPEEDGKKILFQKYDEDKPKIVTDPRKWEIASDMLYQTNNPNVMRPAVGNKIVDDFITFVKGKRSKLNDIVNKGLTPEKIKKMTFDEKVEISSNLARVGEDLVGVARSFVHKNFGSECLALFDSLWVGNNEDRALIIQDLTSEESESSKVLSPSEIKSREAEIKRLQQELDSLGRVGGEFSFIKDRNVSGDGSKNQEQTTEANVEESDMIAFG